MCKTQLDLDFILLFATGSFKLYSWIIILMGDLSALYNIINKILVRLSPFFRLGVYHQLENDKSCLASKKFNNFKEQEAEKHEVSK